MKKTLFTTIALPIILMCAIFLPSSLKAQVPGYQGKRFMAGYGLHISPGFVRMFGGEGTSGPWLNLRHNINAEYIVGRRLAIGADLDLASTGYKYNTTTSAIDNAGNYYQKNKTTLYSVSGYSYGIHFTHYGIFENNPVAPIGDYIRLKLFRLNYNSDIPDDKENHGELKEQAFATNGIGLGYGQTRVYYNKVMLDIGIEGSWLLKNKSYLPFHNEYSEMSKAEQESLSLLFWNYFVNFRIAASGLFF